MRQTFHLFMVRGLALIIALLAFSALKAQQSVGIGTANPNPNAVLELKSDHQGILVPRLRTAQRVQMTQVLNASTGNEGMIVFDLDNGKFYYWFGNNWNEGLGALSGSVVQGDISGSLPDPVVVGLQGRAIAATTPLTSQVLKWDGTAWSPSKDIGIEYQAVEGLQIIGDQISIGNNAITAQKMADGAITTGKITNNAVTLDKIASGGSNTFLSIDENGALRWENKSNLMSSALGEGKILIGNTSETAEERSIGGDIIIAFDGQATIVDNSINSAKIIDGSILTEDLADNSITKEKIAADIAGEGLVQAADGSIGVNAGTGLNIVADALSLNTTGVTAGAYGQPDKTAKFTVDAYGRLVSVEEVAIEASPVGAAGGDLNGTYPNPVIRDGAITEGKLADGAIALDKIKTAGYKNTFLIVNDEGKANWFTPGNNKVIITTNDGQIFTEGRGAFATSALPEGNIFVGNSANAATPLAASQKGRILVGNGTTIASVPVTGDITIDEYAVTRIQPDAITSDKILDGTIQTTDLADASVTNIKLATDAVSTIKIADEAVTSSKIADGTIADADLDKGNIPLSGFGAAAADVDLGANKLTNVSDPALAQDAATKAYVDGQVDSSTDLGEGHVYIGDNSGKAAAVDASASGNILVGDGTTVKPVAVSGDISLAADGTVTIVNDAVTTNKIADGAVTSAKILDGAIQTIDLADASVTNTKLATDAVSTDKITDNSVTNAKIANDAITVDKILDGAITSSKIADGTIADADLDKGNIPLSGFGAAAADVDLGANKLTNVSDPALAQDAATKAYVDGQVDSSTDLGEGHVYIGDNSGKAAAVDASAVGNILVGDGTTVKPVAMSGDISLATDGTVTIGDDAVTANKIADGAITSAKILDATIQTDDLADESVTNTKLATDAVSTDKITDNSVTNAKIANDAITVDKILDGAITSSKIADGTIADADLDKGNIPLSGFGAAAADVDLGDNKLTNVSDPALAQDAATKAYVDGQVDSSTDLGEGHVYIGDNSGKATAVDASASGNILVGDGTTVKPVPVSGDISLATDGTVTIGDDAVTANKIADGAITSAKILDATIQTDDLADESVTNVKLATDAVSTDKIENGAVTSSKIADGTIADADLDKTNITLSGFGAAAADVDLGANKLTNVSDPTLAQDAATKAYVDGQVDSSTDLGEGHVYIGDNSGKATAVDASAAGNILVGDGTTVKPVAVNGDISLAADGTVTIVNDAITTNKIADGAVTSAKILDGTIQTADLADASVTNTKLATDAVSTDKIENSAITSSKIADGTIADADLDKANIPLSGFGAAAADVDLGDNKLTNVSDPILAQDAATKAYVDGQVDSSTDLGEGHVYIGDNSGKATAVDASASGNILVGDGTTVKPVAVGGDISLATDGTVTIGDDAVTTNKIVDGAITSAKILDATIQAADLAGASVTSAKLAADAVSTDKIENGAVTSSKIADGTIADADLDKGNIPLSGFGAAAADVDLGANKLTNVSDPTLAQDAATKAYVDGQVDSSTDLGEGHVYIGDNSGKAASVDASAVGNILVGDGTTVKPVAVGGDISLAADGTVTIGDDAITTNKIVDGAITSAKILDATIQTDDLADESVTTDKIADGTIQTADLADGSVTNIKLAADVISTVNIVDGAITTAKILDSTIGNDDLNKPAIPLSGFGAAVLAVDLGDNKLINVSTPTDPKDAANKAYVDTQVSANVIRGSLWRQGVGTPAVLGTDLEGDKYLNTTNGEIWNYTGSGWQNTTQSIRGPKGEEGSQGPQGIPGVGIGTVSPGDGIEITGTFLGPTAIDVLADKLTIDFTGNEGESNRKLLVKPGGIGANELAANAVTAAKIDNGAITSDKIASEAITTNKIADGAITSQKLNDMSATEGQVLVFKSGKWTPESPAASSTAIITRTGYYAIDPLDFVGTGKDGFENIYYHEDGYVYLEEDGTIAAPVHLPHGAIIEEVTFYYYDNNSANIVFQMARKDRRNGTSEVITSFTSSANNNSDEEEKMTTISNELVANDEFSYRVTANMSSGSGNHRIYSVIIKYTETIQND